MMRHRPGTRAADPSADALLSIVARHVSYRLYRRWAPLRGWAVDERYPELAESLTLYLARRLPASLVAHLEGHGTERIAWVLARLGRLAAASAQRAVALAHRARIHRAPPALSEGEAEHFPLESPSTPLAVTLGDALRLVGTRRDGSRLHLYFERSGPPLSSAHRFFVYLRPDDPEVLPLELRDLGAFPLDHCPAVPFERWPVARPFRTTLSIHHLPPGRYRLEVGVHDTRTWRALPASPGRSDGTVELGPIDHHVDSTSPLRGGSGRQRRRVHWLVPHPIPGSGGHRTIFDHVRHLSTRGFETVLYVQPTDPWTPGCPTLDAAALEARIEELFFPTGARLVSGWDLLEPSDVLFATAWDTAQVVRRARATRVGAYFVQDFEALFHLMGDGYLAAEHTYRLGLQHVTIGRWLTHLIRTHYGGSAAHFDFTVDETTYRPIAGPRPAAPAVAFCYQPEKPRRCPLLGAEALRLLKQRVPDVTIFLYGSSAPSDALGVEHLNLGLLTPAECALLYNRVQVGLCISSSNPSRIPFEMMACRCAVVDIDRENNRHDYEPGIIRLVESSPDALAEGMTDLLLGHADREAQVAAALQFMSRRPSRLAHEQFEDLVTRLLEHGTLGADAANSGPEEPLRAHGRRAASAGR